jgi:DNA-directed RNA polymerase subunit RPC12/RpoP
MPKHQEAAVIGRLSICWKCESEFPLDEDAMTEDKPRCFNCRHKIKTDAEKIQEYLAAVGTASNDDNDDNDEKD